MTEDLNELRETKSRGIVDSHVYTNVSHLVGELSKQDKYMDELMEVQVNYSDSDDDYPQEALEHWVVSDWLGNQLRDNNEMVIDFYGLTIWGRTTSGQAIFLDSIIQSIANSYLLLANASR